MKNSQFGYISTKNPMSEFQLNSRNSIIKSLAVASQETGETATGVITIQDNSIEILKRVENAFKFVHLSEFSSLLKKDHSILIGASTCLIAKPEELTELQPIEAGYTSRGIGTHSGYIANINELSPNSTSSAQALMRALWISGNNYQRIFPDIHGDLTSVWWSTKETDRIYLVRKGEPLFFVSVAELKTTFWSSSKYSLQAALTAVLNKKHVYSCPEEGHVYTITQRMGVAKEQLKLTQTFNTKEDPEWIRELPLEDTLLSKDILAIDRGILAGCEKCKADILEQNAFTFNLIKGKVRCVKCGDTSRPKLDWKTYTDDEYIKLVEDMNWNFTLSNNL